MTKTIADNAAPTTLISMLLRQGRRRWRDQGTTIPACERVEATNTPTAYRGISALVWPPNTTSRAAAASASASVPLLNARPVAKPQARAWRVPVTGHERQQTREAVERCVRCEQQHQSSSKHRRRGDRSAVDELSRSRAARSVDVLRRKRVLQGPSRSSLAAGRRAPGVFGQAVLLRVGVL
jgi:hypothetical protein